MPLLLFDTNIIIDALNRHQPARDILATVEQITLSRISWIEVMAGAKTQRLATEAFLRGCRIVELDAPIAARTVEVRRVTRLKLPDAIIWATALVTGRSLITRDAKDFDGDCPDIIVPYVITR